MCAAEHGYIDVVRMLLANPDVEINIADHVRKQNAYVAIRGDKYRYPRRSTGINN